MNKLSFTYKTFIHFFRSNILVALGVAISTMVLTGSLIIGDSVRFSLKESVSFRLGNTTHVLRATERFFRTELAYEIEKYNPKIQTSSVLMLGGLAVSEGGEFRADKVNVIGVDSMFNMMSLSSDFSQLRNDEVIISENLAIKLRIGVGSNVMVKIEKASLVPLNAPFVSEKETNVTLQAVVKKVALNHEMGMFNLKNSQSAPYNLFLSIRQLNKIMEFEGKANHILFVSDLSTKAIQDGIEKCFLPEDAGLKLDSIYLTNEIGISSERIFIEDTIASVLNSLSEANPILTYFVNAIRLENTVNDSKENKEIPYSFVSTLKDNSLNDNEIILNQWAADDLKIITGDSVILEYFEIGPLRQLITKSERFVVKKIVPMSGFWADKTLMPRLPGLSDAGHCREWEAGIPIKLNSIRDKDEDYWNKWKGTPKAFISLKKANQLWKNRFGNYTSIRFKNEDFNEGHYRKVFSERISPFILGFTLEPVKEQGLTAAKNGTDFAGLFIGLSFFILISSVILTALLFRLSIENRSSQIGILAALGFRKKQVTRFFLSEGILVSVSGGLSGILLSVGYTFFVFKILNTLWFDIVRADVLKIRIEPVTLTTGFLIGIVVSFFAILLTIRKYQMQQVADVQKQITKKTNTKPMKMKFGVMILSLFVSFGMLLQQLFFSEKLNPVLFFTTGFLLLVGLILVFNQLIESNNLLLRGTFKTSKLPVLNLLRNKGRSLTIVILFAAGTFLVVSTGSNKSDLFANSTEKSSGTGGFLFFAESTIPVLYNLNDSVKRDEEGIYEPSQFVQFQKVNGDDASCLNLNRISQPSVIGVNPDALAGRFSFATSLKEGFDSDIWKTLERDFEDGTIPAIADQTVIQWGLGLKIGDLIPYQNEKGDTIHLKLIVGLKPSVFQGYIIISEKNFIKNYPTRSGSSIFLIDGVADQKEQIRDELQSVFRDNGWEMKETAQKLVEFYSVTNTYLSIFMALGTFGLILGTFGLGVLLARTLLERRKEISLLKAIGFNNNTILKIIFSEYFILLVSGVTIGLISAVLAVLPSLISVNTDASFSTVLISVCLIIFSGFVCIFAITRNSIQKKTIIGELRTE